MERSDPHFANLKLRLGAGLFDFLFLALVSLLIMLPSIAGIVNVFLDKSPWSVTALYFLVFLTGGLVATAVVAYEVALPYLWKGQTLGMRFFRLRQVGENRGSLTLKALLVKALASLFLFLTTFGLYYLLEALILRAGKDHRSFADIISRTDVIRLG